MTVEAASDVVEAFNDVLRLSGADTEAIDRAGWRLKGMWRRHPADVVPGLGLLIAHQLRGQRSEAVRAAEELWGRRVGMSGPERAILASLLASMGWYDRAGNLVALGIGDDASARSAVQTIFMGTWDEGTGVPPPQDAPGFAALLDELDRVGLRAHMRDRQTLVNGLIVPHQLNAATSAGTDGSDGVTLTRLIYTDLDLKENMALALRISEAEQSFYEDRGIDVDAACRLVTEVLLPARGQLPATGSLQAEAA